MVINKNTPIVPYLLQPKKVVGGKIVPVPPVASVQKVQPELPRLFMAPLKSEKKKKNVSVLSSHKVTRP